MLWSVGSLLPRAAGNWDKFTLGAEGIGLLTRTESLNNALSILLLIVSLVLLTSCHATTNAGSDQPGMEFIRVSKDGKQFMRSESETKFVPWGVNYDHDAAGRLLEDYWHEEWPTVVEDFNEIKALRANVVRVHLQLAKFMEAPDKANEKELGQLSRLLRLAEETGLYLNITGLGCYHKQDVPEWYDSMDEAERWDVQERFWEAVSRTCATSPAVFCYDLMNEPILAGGKTQEAEWLAGELGGKYFVQRITLDLAGRDREQVAGAWVDKLVMAIRRNDNRHMITVGVIPWAHTWPNAKPLFYSEPVGGSLDFVSVHFYPKQGEVDRALEALATYDIGKPLLIEEMFPLSCDLDEMNLFIDGSRKIAEGWISFYWGRTIEEYDEDKDSLPAAIMKQWLEYFRAKAPEIMAAE